jgi:Lar family restriction alleviation protein
MSETEPKLLACPFCGGKASTGWYKHHSNDNDHWAIGCPECSISITEDDTTKTRAEAIAAWNRRAGATWSSEPPTEEGWYWACMRDKDSECEMVLVAHDPDDTQTLLVVRFWDKTTDVALKKLFTIDKYVKVYAIKYWLKIPVPSLPKEGGKE